jgi:ribosomal protein S8E
MLLVIGSALVLGSVLLATHAQDSNTPSTAISTPTTIPADNFTGICGLGVGMNFGMQGMGGQGIGDQGIGAGGFGGGYNLQVSSAYTANVTSILDNDSDVQNLISQGYNVTAIQPVVSNVIDGNGVVTTQATTAIVIMQNGTLQSGNYGYAQITVDLTQGKVTQIITTTRTVINK